MFKIVFERGNKLCFIFMLIPVRKYLMGETDYSTDFKELLR